MRHNGVRAIETERHGRVFASDREFFYDDLILAPTQKFEFNASFILMEIVVKNKESIKITHLFRTLELH